MDRNPEEIYREDYWSHPFPPQDYPKWPEQYALPPHPLYSQYPPSLPKDRNCCCTETKGTICLMDQRITSVQQTVDSIARHLNINVGPQENMSQPASVQSGELEAPVLVIPGTSRKRKAMIRRMEQELENERQENSQHEDNSNGFRSDNSFLDTKDVVVIMNRLR